MYIAIEDCKNWIGLKSGLLVKTIKMHCSFCWISGAMMILKVTFRVKELCSILEWLLIPLSLVHS